MDAYTRGYRRAAKHLLSRGLCPAPCHDEMRALWAGSREDRALVRHISEQWETECKTT